MNSNTLKRLSAETEPQPIHHSYRFSWFDQFCLWYPPGWLVLFNRHWKHYQPDPEGWNRFELLLFLLPGGFYLALLLRWLRLGCRAPQQRDLQGDVQGDVQVNSAYQQAFRQEILLPILKDYYRAEIHQLENLPDTGPLIVSLNHAGMSFPWDFMGLGVLLGQTRSWFVQPLAHGIFFDHPWLRWWLPAGWSHVLGGVRADSSSFETALTQESSQTILLYAPEGWRGLAKGWPQRYHLQTFDPSFIRLSDRYQIPILPVLCLGNENLHPWAINLKRVAKWVGLPLFPFSPLMLMFILFPSMGVWAARTRLRYYIQPLERPWHSSSGSEPTLQKRSIAYQKAQEMRSRLQQALDALRRKNPMQH